MTMSYQDGQHDGRKFSQVLAYERIATTRDGRTVHIVGQVSAAYFAGLVASGCKVR